MWTVSENPQFLLSQGLVHKRENLMAGFCLRREKSIAKLRNFCLKRKWKKKYKGKKRVLERRQWQPTSVLLPGKSHGRRSLVQAAVHGVAKSRTRLNDFTFTFHFHALEKEMETHSFSLSCIGEGNGNPLQYSCLENPRDGGAWWAAVYGVAQSQTRLKWLSSRYFYILLTRYSPSFLDLWFHVWH